MCATSRADRTPPSSSTRPAATARSARNSSSLLRRLGVINQDGEIVGAHLLEAMRAADARQHRGARRDVNGLAIEGHHASAAQHVVDLVFGLLVVTHARAG